MWVGGQQPEAQSALANITVQTRQNFNPYIVRRGFREVIALISCELREDHL